MQLGMAEDPTKLNVKPKIRNSHVVAEKIESQAATKKWKRKKIKESNFQGWNWRSYFPL
jgi:hypothetical protein